MSSHHSTLTRIRARLTRARTRPHQRTDLYDLGFQDGVRAGIRQGRRQQTSERLHRDLMTLNRHHTDTMELLDQATSPQPSNPSPHADPRERTARPTVPVTLGHRDHRPGRQQRLQETVKKPGRSISMDEHTDNLRDPVLRALRTHHIECTGPGEVTCSCREGGWMSVSTFFEHQADAVVAAVQDQATHEPDGTDPRDDAR